MDKNQIANSIISFLYENIDKAEAGRFGEIYYEGEKIFDYELGGFLGLFKKYRLIIKKNEILQIKDFKTNGKINLLLKKIIEREKENEFIRKNKDLENFMKKNSINVENKKSGMLSIADDETGKLSLVKDGTGSN